MPILYRSKAYIITVLYLNLCFGILNALVYIFLNPTITGGLLAIANSIGAIISLQIWLRLKKRTVQ